MVADADPAQPLPGSLPGGAPVHPAGAQPEGDVLQGGQVGEQQVVLEHHPYRSALGGDEGAFGRVVEHLPVQLEVAGREW